VAKHNEREMQIELKTN